MLKINMKRNRFTCGLEKTAKFFTSFFMRVGQNHIPAYSAQASFFVVISMVPFAMLFLAVLRTFIPITQVQMTAYAHSFLPDNLEVFGDKIIGEIYSNISFSVVSITTIALLWAASKGLKSIVYGLQNVYKTGKPTDFIFNIFYSLLYTLAFIIVMIITIVVLVFGKNLNDLIFGNIPVINHLINNILGFRNLLMLFPLAFIFALFYKFLAKNCIPFKKHFIGGFFSAAGWMLFSFFYSLYIDNFSNYSYIYGSLTAVVLLMLWLYFCMMIFLIGAQINVMYYNSGYSIMGGIKHIQSRINKKKTEKKKYK